MELFVKIKRFLLDPEIRFGYLTKTGFYNRLDDETYLRKKFRLRMGYELDLSDPQTFNEKIQWLKLYDRKPVYTTMADKYAVKAYVENIIGGKYIIPTLGVWDRFEDIDFASLPNQFVLKCTHDSGGLVIVRDKKRFDQKAARKKIERCLKINYYYTGREWPYKNIKPRIIAEKYMEEKGRIVPEDYKVYCINGEPKYIVIFHNRFDSSRLLSETVYDLDWNPQHISLDDHFAVSDETIPKPACIDELIEICRKLCKNMAQVRIDFYVIESKIYFGEITLHTASGFQPMIPKKLDRILGEELQLPSLVCENERV